MLTSCGCSKFTYLMSFYHKKSRPELSFDITVFFQRSKIRPHRIQITNLFTNYPKKFTSTPAATSQLASDELVCTVLRVTFDTELDDGLRWFACPRGKKHHSRAQLRAWLTTPHTGITGLPSIAGQ